MLLRLEVKSLNNFITPSGKMLPPGGESFGLKYTEVIYKNKDENDEFYFILFLFRLSDT